MEPAVKALLEVAGQKHSSEMLPLLLLNAFNMTHHQTAGSPTADK